MITGYFKQIQSTIESDDNPYYGAPAFVIYITTLYYMIQEYFTVVADGIELNENKDYSLTTFGIDSSNKMHTDRYYYDSSLGQKFYVCRLGDTGYKYENDMENRYGLSYGHGSEAGDIIKMTLNTEEKTIAFQHNERIYELLIEI